MNKTDQDRRDPPGFLALLGHPAWEEWISSCLSRVLGVCKYSKFKEWLQAFNRAVLLGVTIPLTVLYSNFLVLLRKTLNTKWIRFSIVSTAWNTNLCIRGVWKACGTFCIHSVFCSTFGSNRGCTKRQLCCPLLCGFLLTQLERFWFSLHLNPYFSLSARYKHSLLQWHFNLGFNIF